MSEAGAEFNPNEEEAEETEETSESEETGEQEQPPGDDAKKLQKALQRERNAKKKALSDLAELRKQSQQGDPNKGEMEKLTEQVTKLQESIATKDRVTTLLEAGFNQSAAKAEKILRVVDSFDDDEWVEELKADYPERFGKSKQPPGPRPHTGSGRAPSGDGTPKNPDATHVDKLLKMGRPR